MYTFRKVTIAKNILIVIFIVLIVVLGNLPATHVSTQATPQFFIYDGQIVYEEEYSYHDYVTDFNIEWDMQEARTTEITVTNLDADTIRFSKEITFRILSAYQQIGETKYYPESYGFRYRNADSVILKYFNDTDSHTTTVIRDVSKTTGMRVRAVNTMGLRWVDLLAYYTGDDIYSYTWTYFSFGTTLSHSDIYFENSTTVNIDDQTIWGRVSNITTVMGRKAVEITWEDIPEEYIEFRRIRYFDVISGLQLKYEVAQVTDTGETQISRTLSSQTVLDTTAPTIDSPSDLTLEEDFLNQQITWHPSDTHPSTYSIRLNKGFVDAGVWDGSEISVDVSGLDPGSYEYTCYVSDEIGHITTDSVQVTVRGEEEGLFAVPGFSIIPTLFGLALLLWGNRLLPKKNKSVSLKTVRGSM